MAKIVFCLPGNSYSKPFFESWLKLDAYMDAKGIEAVISTAGGSNVSHVRERCVRPLRKGTTRPKEPFFGEIDYSHIMWIDSDIKFEPHHFQSLLDKDLDIVAGLYNASDGNFACTISTSKPIDLKANLVEADWVGMGFMLIKKGVFEKIEPPWFQSRRVDLKLGSTVIDGMFVTEDIYFCFMAREAGFKIHIDPGVVVQHLKDQLI